MVSEGINCLELLAGSFAVKSFTNDQLCAHVRLRMDNTTAVAYVNRLGGTHSLVLSNLALALWEWAQKHNILLSAERYAGHLNTVADWARVIYKNKHCHSNYERVVYNCTRNTCMQQPLATN